MYCPRCDREVTLPTPGGIFYCARLDITGDSSSCFVSEFWWQIERDNMAQLPKCPKCNQYQLSCEATNCPHPRSERDPLLVEREKTHGPFKVNAHIFNAITRALPDSLDGPQRAALVMICMKIARVCLHPENKDTWRDIAGYAKLGEEACE